MSVGTDNHRQTAGVVIAKLTYTTVQYVEISAVATESSPLLGNNKSH